MHKDIAGIVSGTSTNYRYDELENRGLLELLETYTQNVLLGNP